MGMQINSEENSEKPEKKEKVEKLINDYPKTILSSIYPVFFGFTLSIILTSKTLVHIEAGKFTLINEDLSIWLSFAALLLYYLVDWLSSLHNVTINPKFYNPKVVMALLVVNIVLCILLIATTLALSYQYLAIGIYLFIVSLFWSKYFDKKNNPGIGIFDSKKDLAKFLLSVLLMIIGYSYFENQMSIYKQTILNFILFSIVCLRILILEESHKKHSA